jgi:hypothetical protein
MNEVRDRARLVDASAFDGRGVTATVPRAEIEGVLGSPDSPPELVLDVERREGDEVEAHTFRLEWDPKELEELLRTTSGDKVTLVLDREELERAIEADVEAHGLREKAAVFAVAATAAASVVGTASAASVVTDGGGGGAAPIAMVSDAGSSGPATTAQAPELVSDAATTGPVERAAAQPAELVSDAATTGPVHHGGPQSPEVVSDAATTGPVGQPMTPAQIVAAAEGQPEMVSDAASSGPVTQAAESSGGGGWDISAPGPTTTGAIAGGAALMIAAAAFAVRGQRKHVGGHPA